MQDTSSFFENVYSDYDFFNEKSVAEWKIPHKLLLEVINRRANSSIFDVSIVGKSVEGRKIMLLKAGSGNSNIIFWSQMHGNEPTATGSLFDIFNFLENSEKYQAEISKILETCTLYFLPMLNPDGAEAFSRRNAQQVDINRDAQKLSTPEAKVLMKLVNAIKPRIGFNLHDQEKYYAAGDTNFPATISLLAPAGNEAKTIDEPRLLSMRLAGLVTRLLNNKIPNQVSQYSDSFMPTAFGDNIQQKGTSVLLIESGFSSNDNDKQYIRKLNFAVILSSLLSISDNSIYKEDTNSYTKLPFNKKDKFFDILIKNITITFGNHTLKTDIGIRQPEIGKMELENLIISDIGDLSNNTGFKIINAEKVSIDFRINIGEKATKLLSIFTY